MADEIIKKPAAQVAVDGLASSLTEDETAVVMTPAERTKLSGVEDNATADQTGAEIVAAIEGEPDQNLLNDAEVGSLSFYVRNTATATAAAAFPDGSILKIEGLQYLVDSASVGNLSATADLSVDGLVPVGTVDVRHFGADPSGTADATQPLKSFFDHCILTGSKGFIGAGTYLVTLGVLAFDNGHVDTAFPLIETAGHLNVTFKANANIDAPFISLTNGTAATAVGNYWKGGGIGGISFSPAAGSVAGLPLMDGVLLRGCESMIFGHLKAQNIGGSTVLIEQKLFATNNPDPYHVSQCNFEAVEGLFNEGRAFTNDNYVGLAGCTIGYIRAIQNKAGAFYGHGAANVVGSMSVGSVGGWAIGEQSDKAGGAPTRFKLGTAEFDDVENGIDSAFVSDSDYGIVRFVHRYNFSSLNPAGGYWPRKCLNIGGPAGAVTNLTYGVIDRIETGGVKGDLGVFADFNSAGGNINETFISRNVIDTPAFGITGADLITNFNSNSAVAYYDRSRMVVDTLKPRYNAVRARPVGVTIPSGGFTGAGNNLIFGTLLSGSSEAYDTATGIFTASGEGKYRISVRIALPMPPGSRIRMAIMKNGSAAVSRFAYANTANLESYSLDTTLDLVNGDEIQINADQNTGAGVALATFVSPDDNGLEVDLLS